MLTTLCPCPASRHTVLDPCAAPLERTVVGAWCNAGVRYGAIMGAIVGAAVALFGGLWVVAYLGVLVGGVVGAILGLVVGGANGIVLSLLKASRAWNVPRHERARRAGWVAAACTVLTIIGLQLLLFRSVTAHDEVVLLDLPTIVGAVAAARLARRLPPVG